MSTPSFRLFIYADDIAYMTGRCLKVARRIMKETKLALNKNRKDLVTVSEFCRVQDLDVELVIDSINRNRNK